MNQHYIAGLISEIETAYSTTSQYIDESVYGTKKFKQETLESLLLPIEMNLMKIKLHIHEGTIK